MSIEIQNCEMTGNIFIAFTVADSPEFDNFWDSPREVVRMLKNRFREEVYHSAVSCLVLSHDAGHYRAKGEEISPFLHDCDHHPKQSDPIYISWKPSDRAYAEKVLAALKG